MDKFILMYPVIGDLIMKLPDEPHHLPALQPPSEPNFVEDPSAEHIQDIITQLLELSIASGGTDVQEKLRGLYHVHCIIPSLYWTRYTESLHCAVCSEVLMCLYLNLFACHISILKRSQTVNYDKCPMACTNLLSTVHPG